MVGAAGLLEDVDPPERSWPSCAPAEANWGGGEGCTVGVPIMRIMIAIWGRFGIPLFWEMPVYATLADDSKSI